MLLALAALPGVAAAQAARPAPQTAALRPVTLVYGTEGSDARQTIRLTRDGAEWVHEETLAAGDLRQTSVRRFRADFSPVSQADEVQVGEDKGKLDVRVADGAMKGTIRAPAQLGGSRDLDVRLPAGTLLPGTDRWVLAASSLAVGRRLQLNVLDPFAGLVRPVALQVVAAERVAVPAGTFDALRVEAASGARLWVRATPPHYLLREETPGRAPVTLRQIVPDAPQD